MAAGKADKIYDGLIVLPKITSAQARLILKQASNTDTASKGVRFHARLMLEWRSRIVAVTFDPARTGVALLHP